MFSNIPNIALVNSSIAKIVDGWASKRLRRERYFEVDRLQETIASWNRLGKDVRADKQGAEDAFEAFLQERFEIVNESSKVSLRDL